MITYPIFSRLITGCALSISSSTKGVKNRNEGRLSTSGSADVALSFSATVATVFEKMSRDVLTVGYTMRIPLLYRGEYLQWVERFMNDLEEQTDGEAMINSIKNDKSKWFDQEKKIQKIDRLARSLLIQRLSNDIYSHIDSNKTAKDLWDALAIHMFGYEYGEQDRKAAV
nr:hypothetical protein [Tanacetum cinerariifolium]